MMEGLPGERMGRRWYGHFWQAQQKRRGHDKNAVPRLRGRVQYDAAGMQALF